MDVDELREKNQKKAEEEAEQGPARAQQDAIPVADAIEDYHARGAISFGIPAHRAGEGDVAPDAVRWAGKSAFRSDPGMNNGVDNRHQSWQVEPTAMQLFAEAVGADQTLFSTNGSTLNVHVAMLTVIRPRGPRRHGLHPLLLRRQRERPRARGGLPPPRGAADHRRRVGPGLLVLQPTSRIGDRLRRR